MICVYCDKEFMNKKSLHGHVARCQKYKDHVLKTITYNFLVEEYITNGKSAIEIANELDYVSANPIIRQLKLYNIPVRNISQSCFQDRKREKVFRTNMEKYGYENVLSGGSSIRILMEQNILEKYGVTNVRKIDTVIANISEKAMETKYRLGLAVRPDLKDEYQIYKSNVINMSNKIFRRFGEIVNPDGVIRYHLDHMVSIRFGFDNNIPPEIISHVSNLCMLEESKNISKGFDCSITIDELYKRIEEYERLQNNENYEDCKDN